MSISNNKLDILGVYIKGRVLKCWRFQKKCTSSWAFTGPWDVWDMVGPCCSNVWMQ